MVHTASYRWHSITDLQGSPDELAVPELRPLQVVWKEQKERLEQSGQLKDFNEELSREFAIETGILENLYTLDRGITQLLVERGIDAALIPHDATDQDPRHVATLIQDQHDAATSLFDFVAQQRELSTSFIKELHAQLTRNQGHTVGRDHLGRSVRVPLLSGEWKRQSNNPTRRDGTVHEYAPPEQVSAEMDRLLGLHHEHEDWPVEVSSAWLYHRFTQIHPFQDGNGRVARCLASLVLIQRGWFPFWVDRDRRADYIEALELADRGDLGPLVEMMARQQKRSMVRALSVAREVEKKARVAQVIEATRSDLRQRREELKQGWNDLKDSAKKVLDLARTRFHEVERELEESLADLEPLYSFEFFTDTEPGDGERTHWFHRQAIEAARDLQYFANLNEHHAWCRLVMKSRRSRNGEAQTEILVSIHGLGREYTGVLGGSVSFFRKQHGDSESPGFTDLRTLVEDVFQLNYAEDIEEASSRFKPWLEDALVKGLDRWRKGL